MKYCEKCGNQLLDEAIMCPQCGASIESAKPTKAQQSQEKNMAKATIYAILAALIVIVTIAISIAAYN